MGMRYWKVLKYLEKTNRIIKKGVYPYEAHSSDEVLESIKIFREDK